MQREERLGVKGLQKTAEMTKAQFVFLLDYQNKVTSPYSQGAFFTYIIDKSGVIRAILAGTTYDRPTGDRIVETLEKLVKGG